VRLQRQHFLFFWRLDLCEAFLPDFDEAEHDQPTEVEAGSTRGE
jgi:hypothetical protein